jgi:thiosulfate reductase cytochrome b subunit
LDYPAISTAGIYAPERLHYTAGFVFLASLLWFIESFLSSLLREHINRRRSAEEDDPVSKVQWLARGAIIGLAVDEVDVDNIDTTAKTLPEFPAMWTAMLDS